MDPISSLGGLPLHDRFFLLLALSIQGLLGLAVLLALLTWFLRWRNTRKARRWERMTGKWDPVILEVLAGAVAPGALQRLVLPTERLDFLQYLTRYARRVRGEESELLNTLARPFLPALAERVKGRRKEPRGGLVRILATLGMPEHAGLLEEALDDPSPLVAFMAAKALLVPGRPESLRRVMARLHRFEGWHPGLLARLLANTGPAAGAVFRAALTDPRKPLRVRAVVAQALRLIGDIGSADAAAEVLESEDDGDLLVACLGLLVDVGESRHRKSILPLLRSEKPYVRAQALRALLAVGDRDDLVHFRKALTSESPWVALEAARGMRALGGTEELEALALSHDPRSTLAREVLAG
jgi:HEAT repeat protein